MRKIYKASWSGSTCASGHRDKLSLLSTSPSTEEANSNGMNSSFDTNTHLSTSEKSKGSQQQPSKHFQNEEEASDPVQFVPAYQEALISTETSPTTYSPVDETSWDAIATDPVNVRDYHYDNSNVRKASTVVGTHNSSSRLNREPHARSKLFNCQSPQPQLCEEAVSISSANYARSVTASTSAGSRMARLASLFSSRAVVPSTINTNPAPSAAPSPPASESSSAFVGWPGTQDKRGGTVVVESSYEESDVSVATTGPVRTATESIVSTTKSYDQAVQEAVDREVQLWMTVDSTSEASSPSKQQQRPDPPSKDNNGHQFQRTPPRPVVFARTEHEKMHRMNLSTTRNNNDRRLKEKPSPLTSPIRSVQEVYGGEEDFGVVAGDSSVLIVTKADPWEDSMSDISTSYSKTSSAYFNTREVQAIYKGRTEHISGVRQNRQAAAAVMRRFEPSSSPVGTSRPQSQQVHQVTLSQQSSLTEEALAMKDQLDPPTRTFNASNAVGYRGLLDKTQGVPNLMDDVDSDSNSAASAATSRHSSVISGAYDNKNYRTKKGPRYPSSQRQHIILEEDDNAVDRDVAESDVFDGISNVGDGVTQSVGLEPKRDSLEPYKGEGILGATSRTAMEKLNLALLGGGLTTIQTTSDDFTNRKTASDFDENLTNSDCDQYGFTKLPAFHEMAAAGRSKHDRSLSSQSLLFTVPSQHARRIVDSYKRRDNNNQSESESGSSLASDLFPSEFLGQSIAGDLSQYYVHPEEMKMVVKKFRKMSRERYPHLDFEDLEREEDATKAFALSEMRSRIMEADIERGLERRGGTTVVDDIVLTPFNRAALRVRDVLIVAKAWRDGATPQDVITTSLLTRRGERTYCIPRLLGSSRGATKYSWEEVNWLDDLELSQYRCHSIGPRHLKGVEMFTIGDCQSILLKLCNERCQELRAQLNDATARQIDIEEVLKEEAEVFEGVMTEAEMTYLTSMEEVKTISHKLVLAEKAFSLVKSRIEKLVAKYESLLVRFENETDSVAPSSLFTTESSYYSDDFSFSMAEEREREALARRAQRAELNAELAAREALLAKQQTQLVREEKEKELKVLKSRLAELQSESSAAITEREHSVVLARAIAANSMAGGTTQNRVTGTGNKTNRSKIDDVKQRFRDRNAGKITGTRGSPGQTSISSLTKANSNSLYRTVGEEMFQHLDFYERSLKAVEGPQ